MNMNVYFDAPSDPPFSESNPSIHTHIHTYTYVCTSALVHTLTYIGLHIIMRYPVCTHYSCHVLIPCFFCRSRDGRTFRWNPVRITALPTQAAREFLFPARLLAVFLRAGSAIELLQYVSEVHRLLSSFFL